MFDQYTLKVRIALNLILVLCLPSCQADRSTTPIRPTPRPVTDAPSTGRLAYIGGDGNIYVTSADRSKTLAVTTDATTSYEGSGLSYQRIAWSPEGRLAYASVRRNGDAAQSRLYVADRLDQPARRVGQSDEHFVIYLYWSPVPCPGRPTCRHLAYLIEEETDIALRLVTIEDESAKNQTIGFGWPFYFSWAADGRSMVWHTGHGRPEAELSLYNLDRDVAETLAPQPGNFLAPAWSPQDSQWLGVAGEGSNGRLQSFAETQTTTLTLAAEGDVAFVWSPNGRQVAYASRRYASDPFYGPIHLFDIQTGQSTRLTDVGLRILAFFWAPDGQRLGYLIRQVLPEAEWMQWRVYDVATDRDRGFATFQPSPQMRFIIASFNQYAQSHRFWSPDGRYLVYGRREGQTSGVWLVDTWAEVGQAAIFIDAGSMGFWSWQ